MISVKEKYTEKERLYLNGFLQGQEFTLAIKALNIAVKQHNGQMRKSGEAYISHPIRIANALISLGVINETVIILALLHDTLEDTKLTREEIRYTFGETIERQLLLLTKTKIKSTEEYYHAIAEDAEVAIINIADRCHNVSTMYFFTPAKTHEYIFETEKFVIPLCGIVADTFPEYADYVYSMKYQMESLLETTICFLHSFTCADELAAACSSDVLLNTYIRKEVPYRLKEIHNVTADIIEDASASIICKLENNDGAMFDYDALDDFIAKELKLLLSNE